uniref:Uncharacterized protein n=2 Tax=Oryza nivara TaxID=4536 RepID=A0A0E0IYE8_ORYNI
MHGRFRGLGFRGGGGGCRSHRGGAAARTPSRLASGIAARWHRLRMCSTPPAGAGEVVRHPGADSLEMDRLHPRRHRRLKGEARGAFSLETSLKIHAISLHPGASIEHQLSYVFANCGCNSIFNVSELAICLIGKELRARVSDIFLNLSLKAIDISGVSMVTTFLAEVPLAKSLTGVLKICVILNASNVVRRRSYSNKVQTAKVTDFYDCDPANPGQPFAPFLFFKRSKKRQPVILFSPMIPLKLSLNGKQFQHFADNDPNKKLKFLLIFMKLPCTSLLCITITSDCCFKQPVISFNPMIPLMLNLSGMKFDCVLQTMIQAKIFLLISIFGDE